MSKLLIQNTTLIDGTGSAPKPAQTILVEEGLIRGIGEAGDFAVDTGRDATVIDGSSSYVTPGLINVHEHLDNRRQTGPYETRAALSASALALRAASNTLYTLLEGVTTIRDVSSKGKTNLQTRDAITAGLLIGPRIYACGEAVSMTGGHGWRRARVADGPEEVRKAVREQIKEGADFIKVMASGGFISRGTDKPTSAQYSSAELQAAAEEAHDAGVHITAHCHPPDALRRVVEAGFDCVEHAALLDKPVAELLAERGVWLVPTLSESFLMAQFGIELGRPQWLVDTSSAEAENRIAHFRHAVDAGVKICLGTDVIGDCVEEMRLMQAGGMSPMQVLQASTAEGARLLGADAETGTVEVGKAADLLVLGDDPLASFSAFRAIRYTVFRGQALDIEAVYRALPLRRPAVYELHLS